MKKGYSLGIVGLMTVGFVLNSFAGDGGSVLSMASGFYAGIGGSIDNVDEKYRSNIYTPTAIALDNYDTSRARLSPIIGVGYWTPFNDQWLWGLSAQWKYLHYKTANENNNHGQSLPNATFSSINIFGPNVLRDFSAQTTIDNVVNFLFYAGEQIKSGYLYIGLGPALFTASNRVFVSSVHEGGGNTLISNSVKDSKTLWGGAIQAGYSYYVSPSYFLNFSYTYSQSGTYSFGNSQNVALLNGAVIPGPITVNLERRINIIDQSFMISINRVFG